MHRLWGEYLHCLLGGMSLVEGNSEMNFILSDLESETQFNLRVWGGLAPPGRINCTFSEPKKLRKRALGYLGLRGGREN